MLSAVPSSGIVNSVIRITGIGDRDRPEWLIRINGMRSLGFARLWWDRARSRDALQRWDCCGPQSGNKLRADLCQGLPRIGTCIARWCSGSISPRARRPASAHVCGSDNVLHFLKRCHGLALAHSPGDVFHVLHEAVETRTAERNLAAAAVENSSRQGQSTEARPFNET
jgi:hypothetical protein